MVKVYRYGQRCHSKASERYEVVTFEYDDGTTWKGWIPIEDRRSGINLTDETEIAEHLLKASGHCHRATWFRWEEEQQTFWAAKAKAAKTKAFFDALLGFEWRHVECELPRNRNWARRTQQLKDFGYTLSTDTNRACLKCGVKGTHILLVPLPRGGISGYETWSPDLRQRIVQVLRGYDAYEARPRSEGLLPDHKFPEVRWDEETRRESLEGLTDENIHADFQLVTNQRNLQKREVCRGCFQTDRRGFPFGIKFFHQGGEKWPAGVPKVGKAAERGCLGCGWYDLEAWRRALIVVAAQERSFRAELPKP